MMATHICMVHNSFDEASAIARTAKWAATVALDAGMRVTIVGARVDKDLAAEVEVRPLYIPPRVHLVQWLAARATIRRAMGDPGCYDLVHVHQAQVAALADIWQVHFLSRPNVVHGGLPRPDRPRKALEWAQLRGVAAAEDRYIRGLNESTELVFYSESFKGQFVQHYGEPARSSVFPNPGPTPTGIASSARRRACRDGFGIPSDAFVVGFLGGTDPRKGGDLLLDAVAATPGVHVCIAGHGGEAVSDARLAGRLHTTGFLERSRVPEFFDAIDVLAVPSRFEPWGVVVNEAAAAGVPSVVAPGVGSADDLVTFGAGQVWDLRPDSLTGILRTIRDDIDGYQRRSLAFADALSFESAAPALIALYEQTLERMH